ARLPSKATGVTLPAAFCRAKGSCSSPPGAAPRFKPPPGGVGSAVLPLLVKVTARYPTATTAINTRGTTARIMSAPCQLVMALEEISLPGSRAISLIRRLRSAVHSVQTAQINCTRLSVCAGDSACARPAMDKPTRSDRFTFDSHLAHVYHLAQIRKGR